jgi:hypothetical protein
VIEYTNPRKCTKCQLQKDLSEFYPRPGGKYLCAECKDCMKIRSKTQIAVDKKVAVVASEADVIIELHKRGIPALPGKALHQQWADVIAYGCVLVGVKSAKRHYRGGYNFAFTPNQRNGKLKGDLVVLVAKRDTGNTYHIFTANNPVFYGEDGRLKTAVTWTPNAKHRGRYAIALTDAMMEVAQDNWDLVDRHLVKVQNKLIEGFELPIRLVAA